MKISYHNHSTFSDGVDSLEQIVAYANEHMFTEIGCSDHFAIFPDDLVPAHFYLKDINTYVSEFKRLEHMGNTKLKMGLEVDYFPETLHQIKAVLAPYSFDYIIGSVHFVDHVPVDVSPDMYSEDNSALLMKKYYRSIIAMAESGLFDIVGHFDLVKKFGVSPKDDLSLEMHEALLAIKKAGMALELNTSGWFYPCKEQYPSIDLLKLCWELDIPILVSADAHKKENLDRSFNRAYELLRELGFTSLVSYHRQRPSFYPIPDRV